MIGKLKALSYYILTLVLIITILPTSAFAHVLKADGNIGAILHIDPADDPIALQPAYFFFDLKDKQNKFQANNCDCTFSISETGNQIYSQPLFESNPSPNLTTPSVIFTFPKKDVYQIVVAGNPQTPNAFQPFKLVYDIRVDKIASEGVTNPVQINNWFSNHLIHFLSLLVVVSLLIFAIVKSVGSKK